MLNLSKLNKKLRNGEIVEVARTRKGLAKKFNKCDKLGQTPLQAAVVGEVDLSTPNVLISDFLLKFKNIFRWKPRQC